MTEHMDSLTNTRPTFRWIAEAFAIYKRRAGTWIGIVLLLIGLAVLERTIAIEPLLAAQSNDELQYYNGGGNVDHTGLIIFEIILPFVIVSFNAYILAGVLRVAALQVRGQEARLRMVFENGGSTWAVLGYSLLAGILVCIGLILFILPGIVLIGLTMPGAVLVADGSEIGEAIQSTVNSIKRHWLMGAAVMTCAALLLFAGLALFFIGIFVTLPIFYLTAAIAARDLYGADDEQWLSVGMIEIEEQPAMSSSILPSSTGEEAPPSTGDETL